MASATKYSFKNINNLLMLVHARFVKQSKIQATKKRNENTEIGMENTTAGKEMRGREREDGVKEEEGKERSSHS